MFITSNYLSMSFIVSCIFILSTNNRSLKSLMSDLCGMRAASDLLKLELGHKVNGVKTSVKD